MRGVDCSKLRGQLLELARGATADAALRAHLAVCPDCARALEEQIALTSALRGLAADAPAPPPSLETRQLAEFDAAAAARRRRHVVRWMPLAAALLIAAFLWGRLGMRPPALQLHEPAPPPAPSVQAAVRPSAAPARAATIHKRPPRPMPAAPRQESQSAEAFVAIPYTVPLAPGERAEVLRMDLPVSAIVAAGLPLEVADAGARARADVLVGADGRARAIRLISISTAE